MVGQRLMPRPRVHRVLAVPALLALASSLLWGVADYLGGTLARRLPARTVVLGSQACAAVVLVPLLCWAGLPRGTGWLGWGIAGGLVGAGALTAFYGALATGTMGVVAPIASLGVVVPVSVGMAGGERPTGLQLAGAAVAIVGVVLASGPELRGAAGLRPVLLAAVAALGFGLVLVTVARGSSSDVLGTLTAMRVTSTLGLAALAAVLLRRRRQSRPALTTTQRQGRVPLGVPVLLVAIGAGDLGANATYAVATGSSLESVAAVLASLYPVVTVLLARAFDGERLRWVQQAGVVASMAGVLLVAGG